MRKTCTLLFSLILSIACFTIGHAQDGQIPAPISVTIDSYQSIQELPQPRWLIKEGENPLTIQDILNGEIKDGQVLEVLPGEVVIERFKKYWFVVEFISEVELRNWLLYIENSSFSGGGITNNFSELRSFSVQDGQLTRTGFTGYFIPASQRDYNRRHTQSLLNLSLSPGSSTTLWIHIDKNYTFTTTFPHLSIYDPSIAMPDYTLERRDLLLQGSYLIIWILSLIMYFFLKDRISLWFFIFLTTANIQFLTYWSSDPLTSLLYPENPGYGLYFGLLAAILNVVSTLQFSRVFVNLPMKRQKLDRFMIMTIWVLFFSGLLLPLSIHFERIELISVFFAIYGGIFLLSGIIYLSLKEPLSIFIGLVLLIVIIPQLIPLPFDYNHVSITGQLFIVTIAVGYRIILLFKERLQLEQEKKDILIQQNTLLEKQVADRTAALNHSLENLKSTQAQLIQSEKMASLGELTAGIAHEIQNPLNFVNNFSEISSELVEELKGERLKVKGERDEEMEGEILNDISQNLQKINHHGKRADAIVKGMLQHSRTSSGQKEPTDINALAHEYLRLSYHGLRAKDNSFNASFETHFDPDLPKVEVVPQDIGRVLLNLINNAFYAVQEKSKKFTVKTHGSASPQDGLASPQDGGASLSSLGYKPTVTVSTQNLGDKIGITVKDNGPGIPDEIKNKIFQPFFTTKPTGQGTGLGLSLSYDIVKAHGGELKVETKEGEGSVFTFMLSV